MDHWRSVSLSGKSRCGAIPTRCLSVPVWWLTFLFFYAASAHSESKESAIRAARERAQKGVADFIAAGGTRAGCYNPFSADSPPRNSPVTIGSQADLQRMLATGDFRLSYCEVDTIGSDPGTALHKYLGGRNYLAISQPSPITLIFQGLDNYGSRVETTYTATPTHVCGLNCYDNVGSVTRVPEGYAEVDAKISANKTLYAVLVDASSQPIKGLKERCAYYAGDQATIDSFAQDREARKKEREAEVEKAWQSALTQRKEKAERTLQGAETTALAAAAWASADDYLSHAEEFKLFRVNQSKLYEDYMYDVGRRRGQPYRESPYFKIGFANLKVTPWSEVLARFVKANETPTIARARLTQFQAERTIGDVLSLDPEVANDAKFLALRKIVDNGPESFDYQIASRGAEGQFNQAYAAVEAAIPAVDDPDQSVVDWERCYHFYPSLWPKIQAELDKNSAANILAPIITVPATAQAPASAAVK